ncbi:MAG: pyrroloquinoline quinone biosynthesis protein PqqB [Hydrogenophaga sp.]|jgi:pyrroloquinoline quinone biosynthesis protein B|uniref:pyrroloquinoline quinone biosynthesis protein PqqB n=1 Tax=Hydrogenophaga sp. TaxID=1904254 RepID=UPI002ABB38EA|nr:pyrroloquinoline quinone biosynthesis protein PqqB [Hydrogenophaga sp.]MDZ4103575.1 pyrroloquinoline quinone biosynthesis protein PqqB [Hydrogenophaga sp.]
MRIRVLGSSAGGGFPQWNCNCANCDGLRHGRIKARARTQSSIAVTANGLDWLLVNASPDILTQIRDTPDLQPARAVRDSGIAAVLLMDAQIDHVTGLIMLRERGSRLPLLATPEVLSDISSGFPITGILSHYCGVATTELPSDGRTVTVEGLPGIEVQTVAIASKPPPYSPFRGNPRAGDNLGLVIQNPVNGARVFYAPGLGAVTPELLKLMASCSVLLVDGTFWTEDEMITQGLSKKKAAEMGHLPQSGPGGMIEQLDKLPGSIRKILIHINNTNPMLIEDSAERAELTRHGIEVAHDGMDIVF